MTSSKTLIYGYVPMHEGTSEVEAMQAELLLFRWAQAEGYDLAAIYQEERAGSTAALTEMIRELRLTGDTAVVVPSARHLTMSQVAQERLSTYVVHCADVELYGGGRAMITPSSSITSMFSAPTRPLGTFPLRGVVPYITAWSSEKQQAATLVSHRGRLGYADEHPLDRDTFGILWRRVSISPGTGKPEYGKVHSLRQRRTMLRVLCQVCGGPADETREGVLWLMGRAEYEREPWPAPIESPHPPVCLNCAVRAVQLCPHLRDHYVAVRAVRFHLSGVHGARYMPTAIGPKVIDAESYALGSTETRWVQASQLIMRLVDYRVVDLDAEAAAHHKES